MSAIAANSAQMTSADNAISLAAANASAAAANASAAAAAVSAAHASLVGSVAGALSAIAANSAQMTSADNAISLAAANASAAAANASAAAAAVSAAHTSLAASVAGALSAIAANSAAHTSLAGSVAGALSAIAANSAQMTSADNAISGAVAALSLAHASLATSVAGALSAIAVNSADVTSGKGYLSARIDSAEAAGLASVAAAGLSLRVDSVGTNIAAVSAAVNVVSNATSALGIASWRRLADNQILSATAPVSVSGFTFTCSAGVGYSFEFGIYTSAPISLAANKFVLSFPSSSPVVARFEMGGAPAGITASAIDRTNLTVAMTTVSAIGVPIAARIHGTFRCSANGGTFALAMGNGVSGGAAGSSITILAGSYGYIWKMA